MKRLTSLRLDLVIAVCALLISTLATAASWWQTRATYQQTEIIQQQLSAQVWPYVAFDEGVTAADSVAFSIENDGLGPAVIRSEAVFVDGKERSSFVDVLHAVLGQNIRDRRPRGESMGLTEDGNNPGFVLRPGDSTKIFSFRSKSFGPRFIRAYARISFSACYCAIVPGKCWRTVSAGSADPHPVPVCPEDRRDLLHASEFSQLFHSY